ncbi:MAG: hypothetical protein RL196_550 [Actinomycetota bacterium]|jgi:hypothetical protein
MIFAFIKGETMNQQQKATQQWVDALRSQQPIIAAVEAGQLAAATASAGATSVAGSTQVSEGATPGGAATAGGSENRATQQQGALALPDLHVGRGLRYGNLTWFPIFTDAPVGPRGYATAATAAKVGVVENASPSVGHLQVRNDSEQPVLLFEGSLLEGGWQHRALTHTVWVDARSTAEIPVVCVEAGRWNGVSTQNFGNKTAPARVRRAMRGIKVNAAGAASQTVADQSEVWNEVNNFATATKKQRPTQSLVEMANEIQQDIAALGLTKPQPLYGQRGVLVAVAGKPLALEVFDHPDTLAERLESILDAYLPESMALPYATCRSQLARDFVARVETLGVQPTEHAGRLRNRADKYVASEAVTSKQGAFLHLATLNPAHELVLAA